MKRTWTGLVVAFALVTGCASSGSGPKAPPSLPSVDLGRVTLSAAQLDALSAADGLFAGDLYRAVADSEPGNLAMSPASVAIALQMAYAGARGRTAAEMAKALHVTGTAPLDVAAAAATFLRDLAPLATDKRELLSIANNVWVQSGLPLVPTFDTAMCTGFGAGMRRTEFSSDPEGARQSINAAVAAETRDKIQNLLPPGSIDSTIRLVLTNAVYLLAKWASPFDGAATNPRPFHGTDGSTFSPQTMEQQATFGYRNGDGYQAVRLPYAGGRLAMTILLPDAGVGPLEQRLATDGLGPLTAGLRDTPLTLDLPRFRFTWAADLTSALQSLGMTTAFTGAADFTGMTTAEPLSIGFVRHQAFIAVDEKGTEAAAATAVGIVGSAMRVTQPTGITVRVDHPFLFAITDTTTGLPLFLGRVTNPS